MDKRALEQARALLSSASSVVTFSGAGLSAESGLSTFRDPDKNSLWSRFNPTELASLSGFEKDPERVLNWYAWRRSKHGDVKPNPAHHALAEQAGLMHVTQNVDSLLEQAGAREKQVFHLHGTIGRDKCHADCGYSVVVDMAKPPSVHSCPRCEAPMRPAVVWFGESLPQDTWQKAQQLCLAADCLLVIGTSAAVYPAAGLIELVATNGGRIISVNVVASEHSVPGVVELIGPAGELVPGLLSGLILNS